MKRNHKNKRTENGSLRYVSKSVHRTLNARGIGFNLIEELRKELLPQRGVKL
ncbi:MAG TPA: hypothetical protein VI423_02985 [Paenisporosarcina sp.]|nr:hypothetical protein [Paenisporosarcina sp.]